MPDLTVHVDTVRLGATWIDQNARCRPALEAALPVEGDASRWGDELYVDSPVALDPRNTNVEVDVGTVAYWPRGQALCVFWGPTPASAGSRPRAASPVAPLARLEDTEPLADVEGDARLRFEAG